MADVRALLLNAMRVNRRQPVIFLITTDYVPTVLLYYSCASGEVRRNSLLSDRSGGLTVTFIARLRASIQRMS